MYLIKEPEAQIERFGLKAKDYLALKFKFPRGVRIDGHEIEPFPILIIRDRNYKSWLDNFKARMEKALEENKDNLEPAPMLAFMYDVMGRSEKRRQDEKMKRAKAEVLFRDYEQHFQEPPLEEQVAKVEEVGHFFDAMAKQEAEKEKG